MASLFTYQTLPTSSEQALREFDERYLKALTSAEAGDWFDEFVFDMPEERVTFPFSYASHSYKESKFNPGSGAEDPDEGTFDLKVVEYDTEVNAPLKELLKNVYRWARWAETPARWIAAERYKMASLLAAQLEDAAAVSPWDAVTFWSAAGHKANPKKEGSATWGNFQSAGTAISLANIAAEMATMKTSVLDLDGRPYGLNPTEIWVPSAKAISTKHLLTQAHLASGEDNVLLGALEVVEIKQLTDANDWYLVDREFMSREGLAPVVLGRYQLPGPLALKEWGEESDFFKNTSRIKKASHITLGTSFVFPHAIRRVTGA